MATQLDMQQDETRGIVGFNHVAMPVRDVPEALRFWTTIFGAHVIGEFEDGGFGMVAMPGNFLFGFSQQDKGVPTGRRSEFPHYGMDTDPERMEALRDRLTQFGVPVDHIWTRFKSEALMYFRDPSGNLFELYCHEGYGKAQTADLGRFYGGQFETDLDALNYDSWNDPAK